MNTQCCILISVLVKQCNKMLHIRIEGTLRHTCLTIVAMEKECFTYSECLCVSIALAIQHAMHMHHILNCVMSGCITFFHIS